MLQAIAYGLGMHGLTFFTSPLRSGIARSTNSTNVPRNGNMYSQSFFTKTKSQAESLAQMFFFSTKSQINFT